MAAPTIPKVDEIFTDPRRNIEEKKRLLKLLRSRAQIPTIPETDSYDVPHLDNVQGDHSQRFIFFRIRGVAKFKDALPKFKPTSAAGVRNTLLDICWNKDEVIKEEIGKERARLIDEARAKAGGATTEEIGKAIEEAQNKPIDWTKLKIPPHKRIELEQRMIAFSRTGLNVLGITENTGDKRFDERRMNDDRVFLGDQSPWAPLFDLERPPGDAPPADSPPKEGTAKDVSNPDALHGVMVIAGDIVPDPRKDKESKGDYEKRNNEARKKFLDEATKRVKDIFGDSLEIREGWMLDGQVRPQPYKDHEHFGFMDGISQPAIRGIEHPLPGQTQVDPGVIIMGYPGDPVPKSQRPGWCKDGTMMVFRKLEQSVLLFEQYCKDNGPRWREFIPGGEGSVPNEPLSDKEGAELFAARMVGRWKSGAPLALAPFRDDRVLAADPKRNNDFDYTVTGVPGVPANRPSNFYCPFTAHTRKTGPRNLDPYVSREHLASSSIVRAGIPYGPEIGQVDPAERGKWGEELTKIKAAHVNGTTEVDKAEEAVRAAKQKQAKAAEAEAAALKEVEELREQLKQDPGSKELMLRFEAALRVLGAARLLLEECNKEVAQAEEAARAARVRQGELNRYPKEEDRGLLFVCYASHLDSGFVHQTTQFGNNDFFPSTELKPIFHGQDPIIGGPPAKRSTQEIREVRDISNIPTRFVGMGDTRVQAVPKEDVPFKADDGKQVHFEFKVGEKSFEVSGLTQDPTKNLKDPENYKLPPGADNPYFVTSRGGEYFFVPSLKTLKDFAKLPDPKKEGSK